MFSEQEYTQFSMEKVSLIEAYLSRDPQAFTAILYTKALSYALLDQDIKESLNPTAFSQYRKSRILELM